MRIVSEWTYKHLRVTIFHYNERYSIKLEDGLLEQTYKFRSGQVDNLDDIKKKVNTDFYDKAINIFKTMNNNKTNILESGDTEEEFDLII